MRASNNQITALRSSSAALRPLTLTLALLLLQFTAMLSFFAQSCHAFSTSTTPSSQRTAAFAPTRETTRIGTGRAIGNVGARGSTAIHSLPTPFDDLHSNIFLSAADDAVVVVAPTPPPMELSEALPVDNLQIEQLSPTTTVIVFVVGIIPFVWATFEFWRRIAVGASFGTGSDSVVIPSPFEDDDDDDNLIAIGEDGNPKSSRGRQTLDRGALTVAYVLFAAAGGSVALALASVLMGPTAAQLP